MATVTRVYDAIQKWDKLYWIFLLQPDLKVLTNIILQSSVWCHKVKGCEVKKWIHRQRVLPPLPVMKNRRYYLKYTKNVFHWPSSSNSFTSGLLMCKQLNLWSHFPRLYHIEQADTIISRKFASRKKINLTPNAYCKAFKNLLLFSSQILK